MIIYKATNKINFKVYIGQTRRGLKQRIKEHKSDSKNKNTHFHRAIRKYGINNFDFIVLFETDNLEILNSKEIEFIKIYNSSDKTKGYNLRLGGNESTFSKETLDLISNKKLEWYKFNKSKCAKPIRCINDGQVFESSVKASEYYNLNRTAAARVANGERNSCYGLKFEYILPPQ